MININNLHIALPLLVNNDTVFENLKKDFPQILADLTTFKTNPNCTCRGRVFKFFADLLPTNPTLLDKYITDTNLVDEINKGIINAQNSAMINNYSGKIFTIGKTEQDWLEFSQSLLGKIFRGFSVVEHEDRIVVYIL